MEMHVLSLVYMCIRCLYYYYYYYYYLLQLSCHSVAVVHTLDTDKTNKNKYT